MCDGLEPVVERLERLGLAAGRVGERPLEQPVREPGVSRQQRAVQVRAVDPAVPAPLEARLAVVPEPREDAPERKEAETAGWTIARDGMEVTL